jgi:hypothetical protein
VQLDKEISDRNSKKSPQKSILPKRVNNPSSRKVKNLHFQERQSVNSRQSIIGFQEAFQEDSASDRTKVDFISLRQHLRVLIHHVEHPNQTIRSQQIVRSGILRVKKRLFVNGNEQPLGLRVLL